MSAHGDVDLGHTVAGWTGTVVAVIGFAVLGAAVVTVSLAVAVSGLLVIAVAVLITWLLHLAGWGKPSGPRPQSQWSWRVRDLSAHRGHPGCMGCRLAGRTGRTVSSTVIPEPAPEPASVHTALETGRPAENAASDV
ncbi:HGxxPAAW family protein [Streptomyces sp. NPDC059582]|uniref:HGxxPAAW family protein n=1 Tax=Streptomyces sp. NPDC059582 TaxID=3346875 RepID=UPI003692F316